MLSFLSASLDWRGLSGRGAFAIATLTLVIVMAAQARIPALSMTGAAVALAAAAATLVFWGHARRRLRALGWSGWWMWALVVPGVSLVVAVILVIRPTRPEAAPGSYSRAGRRLIWVLVALIASRMFWAPYTIPTGSMSPTLQPGDYLLASRSFGPPSRGDVLVFRHPVTGVAFIKRVIALPGDTVQMQSGQVILNGTPVPQRTAPDWIEPYRATAMGTRPRCLVPVTEGDNCVKQAAIETLPNGASYTVLNIGPMATDESDIMDMPDGQIFVLGDNRDNSLDSRIPQSVGGVGLVPLENVVGRVRLIVFSQEGRESRSLRFVK